MSIQRKKLGTNGEILAAVYLSSLGWKVVGQNVHLKVGEIDLLAECAQGLVIVEVKSKTSDSHGRAVEMITPAKRRVLRQLAKLVEQAYNKPVRIDVIAIDNFASPDERLMHYQGAVEEE